MAAIGSWYSTNAGSASAAPAVTEPAAPAASPQQSVAQSVQLVGTIAGGLAKYLYADAQASAARSDAASERDAATAQAKLILRAMERRRGEARAATAGSGARIDGFSLANEQEILAAGETDAAMSILSGKRRSRALQITAGYQRAAGMSAVAETLFDVARQKKWAGGKAEFYDGTTGDSSAY